MEFSSDLAFTRENDRGTVVEPSYGGATSFMRRRYTRNLENIDVAVVGIPYDLATTNRSGTRLGPRAIRSISSNLSWETAVNGWGYDPFERISVVDYGDFGFDPGLPADIPAVLESQAREILKSDTAILALGGDHFITYPLLKACAEKHGPLSLIHFDAHSDTWEDEVGRIDHGTMFWHAAQDGTVDPGRSIQLGMRTHNPDTHGYNVYDADWVHDHSAAEAIAKIHETVGDNPCYLTFDIDCLDPSFAPGTGTPVVGGLSTQQALRILRGLGGLNIVGMDLVEVAPAYDVSEVTALAGATLALNMLCIYSERSA
ncbi:agmatinase [Congregibacter litoralis]|uniref:Agmatinase n=1 Tax=Congregibacter litoralis KT71 TaxID=314285 RepID=A4A8U4_9GAMM|nr:agmatinase [Congregibacter litoralis]EAQ97486.1 agmatinase [Congregibacter litoralis KT71]